MVKQIPRDFPAEFTLKNLADWFVQNEPMRYIGMTAKQEQWYRNLFPPQNMLPAVMTFHGVPVIIYDETQA